MKKKRLRLKPFNLEDAKAGKPICTRDGREVRIICFNKEGDFPIVALIKEGNKEIVYPYKLNGCDSEDNIKSNYDLMMAPHKITMYTVIRKGPKNVTYVTGGLYKTRSLAESFVGDDIIAVGEVNWIE